MALNMNSSSDAGSRQFKATRKWNCLIQHLKDNVNMKRRRNRLKLSDECFTGANAVDVLLQFVKQNPGMFDSTGSVSRGNIVRLCQAFVDCGVLKPVLLSTVPDKHIKFEDSTSSFYNFVGRNCASENDMKMSEREVLKEIDGDIRNSMDHITISGSGSSQEGLKSYPRFSPVPHRRSCTRARFPSISGISAKAFKDSVVSSISSNGQTDRVGKSKRRSRGLKRSSSFDSSTLKRCSSDRNLSRTSPSSSYDSDHSEGRSKKDEDVARGGKLRLSGRLSFRRRSSSPALKKQTQEHSPQHSRNPKTSTAVHGKPPIHRRTHMGSPAPDTRRRSIAASCESSKPTILSRVTSAASIIARLRTREYIVSDHPVLERGGLPPPPLVGFEPASDEDVDFHLRTRTRPRGPPTEPEGECLGSPAKQPREGSDEIKDTPSRFGPSNKRASSGPVAFLSSGMSQIRRSLRRKASESGSTSCVIKNVAVASNVSVKPVCDETKKPLSDRELLHLRRECVRVRLLQILDLPFVDNVISSPTERRTACNHDVAGEGSLEVPCNDVHFSEVASAYYSTDSWIRLALAVLRNVTNAYVILQRHARDPTDVKKLKLFSAISEHYASLTSPLVDETLQEICDAIIETLTTRPSQESLEACQLFLHLLPDPTLAELRHLIDFLHCVVTSDDVVVVPGRSNRNIVLSSFPQIIFCLATKEVGQRVLQGAEPTPSTLLHFLIEHRESVFTLPDDVIATFNRKRHLMEIGEIESPSVCQDSTFCTRISSSEYNQQRVEFTRKQLSELGNFIESDPNVAPKRKKDLLKKLQSAHPSAFERGKGPVKARHPVPVLEAKPGPRQLPQQIPNTEPLYRRRSNARQKQIYV